VGVVRGSGDNVLFGVVVGDGVLLSILLLAGLELQLLRPRTIVTAIRGKRYLLVVFIILLKSYITAINFNIAGINSA
jgi:hypothetical protein